MMPYDVMTMSRPVEVFLCIQDTPSQFGGRLLVLVTVRYIIKCKIL